MLLAALAVAEAQAGGLTIEPRTMRRVGTVDERFQSYNIEMVEVTGGRFWKPYAKLQQRIAGTKLSHDIYAYRPPIDLANTRLRRLAAALGPAYLRISGTWANATYFADSESPPTTPPDGFDSVLTRPQWRGVVDFAKAVDARIVTSFAVSPGTRDRGGVWSPDQASRLLAYTSSLGATVAGAEYMNEPTLAAHNGAPSGYDANAYARDFQIFREFLKRSYPETLILGPGSVGDSPSTAAASMSAQNLLTATGHGVDVFSYHHYSAVSPRCGGRARPEDTLTEERLARTDKSFDFYRSLRDRFEPGKPIWLTETADAACGGNAWDATFVDMFRYLDQLGRLARAGVQVIMHNTLAASDYGLLDEKTFSPRPNYWAALLWHRLMGKIVLDPGLPGRPGLHIYAHCTAGAPGGVSVLAINTSRKISRALNLPVPATRYTLQAARLQSHTVQLNGGTMNLAAGDELPNIAGAPTRAGTVTLSPATITFLSIHAAANETCR